MIGYLALWLQKYALPLFRIWYWLLAYIHRWEPNWRVPREVSNDPQNPEFHVIAILGDGQAGGWGDSDCFLTRPGLAPRLERMLRRGRGDTRVHQQWVAADFTQHNASSETWRPKSSRGLLEAMWKEMPYVEIVYLSIGDADNRVAGYEMDAQWSCDNMTEILGWCAAHQLPVVLALLPEFVPDRAVARRNHMRNELFRKLAAESPNVLLDEALTARAFMSPNFYADTLYVGSQGLEMWARLTRDLLLEHCLRSEWESVRYLQGAADPKISSADH